MENKMVIKVYYRILGSYVHLRLYSHGYLGFLTIDIEQFEHMKKDQIVYDFTNEATIPA